MKKLLLISTVFLYLTVAHGQENKVDSLLSRLKKDKEDTNKVNHLNALAWEYKYNNPDTAILLGNQALALAEKIKFEIGIGKANHNLGTVNYLKGDYAKALEHYFKALATWEKLEKSVPSNSISYILNLKSKSLGNIGAVYKEQGDYPKALDYDFKALKTAEELGDKNGIARNLGNIGIIYMEETDYAKALDYYFKALKMDEELGDKSKTAAVLGNIGIVYKEQAMVHPAKRDSLFSKALDCYFKALKFGEELGEKKTIAINLSSIGVLYDEQADYSKALDYYFKALKLAEEMDRKNGIAGQLCNIGSLYITTGKFTEAEKYLKQALALSDSIGTLDITKQVEQNLSQLYDTLGQLSVVSGQLNNGQRTTNNYQRLALEHYKKYITARDSISNDENKKKQLRTEVNYEFEKKEALTKAEQDKKDAVTLEEKRKQKIITYSVSGGLFLVLLLALFIFRGYKQKQKANIIITQQKNEVEKAKHIIEEKNKDITDSINYAKRIQQAKLPKREEIYSAFPDSFVLFKPKDIVSGDFYYFHKNDKSVFIASADCTGHGVPGAFMSMIGSEKLDDALAHSADTSEILRQLNKGIKVSLHQTDSNESTRDGMDIALCSVDTDARVVKYAGANRPLWIIRNGQTVVEEIKATKKAIGGFTEDSQHFDTHVIQLQQGDTFYIFSDGFADTFGGAEQKKVTTKKFKEILLSIQDKSLKEQEHHLDNFIENWKGGTEQVDDILVIGVRL